MSPDEILQVAIFLVLGASVVEVCLSIRDRRRALRKVADRKLQVAPSASYLLIYEGGKVRLMPVESNMLAEKEIEITLNDDIIAMHMGLSQQRKGEQVLYPPATDGLNDLIERQNNIGMSNNEGAFSRNNLAAACL